MCLDQEAAEKVYPSHAQATGLYESTQPGAYTPHKFPKKTAQYLYPLNGRPNCE